MSAYIFNNDKTKAYLMEHSLRLASNVTVSASGTAVLSFYSSSDADPTNIGVLSVVLQNTPGQNITALAIVGIHADGNRVDVVVKNTTGSAVTVGASASFVKCAAFGGVEE